MPYLDLAHATMLRVSKKEKPGVKEAVALYVQAGQYFATALKLKYAPNCNICYSFIY